MKSRITWVAAAAALGLGFPAAAQDAALIAAVEADYDARLESLFRHFHAHPELSGLEFQTSARMARELEALGYEVTTGVGGTGVVAVLANGPGPTVMIRADMDGLPIREATGLPHASTAVQVDHDGVEKPVMHACGHDSHITALIGVARQMMDRRDRWSGTLVLIAQPAEETLSGARAMLDDDLYQRFPKPDYALALHVNAGAAAGQIQIQPVIAYSSADSVYITVRGVGAHGATPHRSVDPVVMAAHMIVALQTLRSRNVHPLQGAAVTVGAINGGSRPNIIPEQVDLQLTVRADDPAVRTQLLDGIDRIALGVARTFGVPDDRLPIVTRSPTQATPAVLNDTATAERVSAAISRGLGPGAVVPAALRPGMGSEDFAYFVQPELGVRGVYFAIGGRVETAPEQAGSHHTPLTQIEPEPVITRGVVALVSAAEDLMPKP